MQLACFIDCEYIVIVGSFCRGPHKVTPTSCEPLSFAALLGIFVYRLSDGTYYQQQYRSIRYSTYHALV